MDNNLLIAIVAIIAALIILLLLLRARGTKPVDRTGEAPEGVGAGPTSATADIVGEFLGIELNPDLAGPPDELTRLKGLGPRAATQLEALGITRYAQLASLDEAQMTAVDGQMGALAGRIQRDRWVEQARLLAAGDTAGFEARFGKLG